MVLTKKGSHRIASFICDLCGEDSSKTYVNRYKEYLYKGKPVLVKGNTELFTVDIFNICEFSII